jgi:hypothetical protein
VFPLHQLSASGKNITDTLSAQGASAADLLLFLRSIDGTTDHLRSEGDEFRDFLRTQGTCPSPAPAMTQSLRVPRLDHPF